MNFLVTGNTDVGLVKKTNQDSLSIKVINTKQGKMVLAVLCDGMGGLQKGEVASASLIYEFDRWCRQDFSVLTENRISNSEICKQWENIVKQMNNRIMNYGKENDVRLGTTVTAILLTQEYYYIMNVGDTRAYEISDKMIQLTNDHSLVAREVALGHLTPEEAEHDKRRNVLLRCVGATETAEPDMFFGKTKKNAVYMLCSDGFRHEISPYELYEAFKPEKMIDEKTMNEKSIELIELNKERKERDNISVILIKTTD